MKVNQELAPMNGQIFLNKLTEQLGAALGDNNFLSEHERNLILGYFVMMQVALQEAEIRRNAKNKNNKDHNYDENLACTWENVYMNDLATMNLLVYYARLGLDANQPNNLSVQLRKDSKIRRYRLVFTVGYTGRQTIANRFALDRPENVTTELIYSKDTFRPIKQTDGRVGDSYVFEINDPWDRGEIKGGFIFHRYEDPAKNNLVIMSEDEILRHKPDNAAADFWGGIKTGWKDGKKVEYETEGWKEKMYLKTLRLEAYHTRYIPLVPKAAAMMQYINETQAEETARLAEDEKNKNANLIEADFVIMENNEVADREDGQGNETSIKPIPQNQGHFPTQKENASAPSIDLESEEEDVFLDDDGLGF